MAGAGTSLSSLRKQRDSVLIGINDVESTIFGLNVDLERLEKATNRLSDYMDELEGLNKRIANREIDEQIWRGKEKEAYQHDYDYYHQEAKAYMKQVKDAKDEIDKAIVNMKSSIQGRQTGLDTLNSTLDRLNADIRLAREDG